MAAGLRTVLAIADLIDVVLEVRDARVPRSTAVAHLHRKLKGKPLFVLLNREDLANQPITKQWLQALAIGHTGVFSGVGTRATSLQGLRRALAAQRTRRTRTRVAVVGAPNTGKSSVINALIRRKSAIAQDKPGVTRHVRWIPLDEKTELLDTPGVLEPQIRNEQSAWQLAACGILPETALDSEEVAARLAMWIRAHDLETYARQRGMLRRGGEPDRVNAARAFIREFRDGKLGRFSFESPEPVA